MSLKNKGKLAGCMGRFGLASSFAAVAICGLGASAASAAETKSFVISYFYEANFSDGKTDCPTGLNLSAIDFYRRDLAKAGHSHDEIEAALKDFPGRGRAEAALGAAGGASR